MLNIRNLKKIYSGPFTALDGVCLEVGVGMFGLLGPNGAGKSTLMRIVAGLLEPTSGTVTLDGDDVLASPERIHERLGYLPQDFGFYPHLTGVEMLTYLLRLKGVEAKAGLPALARDLLEHVNLTAHAGRKVEAYSGGMRQRLGIAQAIAGDPRIIIVDEPTNGLDPEERLRLYDLLAQLAESRIVLLSTHLVEDVAILCPRFAVIRSGQLLADTTPRAACAGLDGRIFEGSVPRAQLDAIRRDHRVARTLLVEGRHRVRLLCDDGAPPAGFEPSTPTLEDAYLLLTHKEPVAGAPA